MNVIKSWTNFDVLKQGNSEDGKDEHDEEK